MQSSDSSFVCRPIRHLSPQGWDGSSASCAPSLTLTETGTRPPRANPELCVARFAVIRRNARMIDSQELSEAVRAPIRVSVSLDASLAEFVQRAAMARHQKISATVRAMIAELASRGTAA
jgi:hypothetical protein